MVGRIARTSAVLAGLLLFTGCRAPDSSVDGYVASWQQVVAAAPGGWSATHRDADDYDPSESDLFLVTRPEHECTGVAVSALTVDPVDPDDFRNVSLENNQWQIDYLMDAVGFAPDPGSAAVADARNGFWQVDYTGACIGGSRAAATVTMAASNPSSTGLGEALFIVTSSPSTGAPDGVVDADAVALTNALIKDWAESVRWGVP